MKVLHKLRVNQANNSWVDIRIVCKHAAIEPVFQLSSDLRADVAKPDDAYGFSLQLADLRARAIAPCRAVTHASVGPHELFGRSQHHHDRMLGDWHSAETLMVDNEDAVLRRSRNIDVVGAEPRCRYHHQFIAGVQYFSRHTLGRPNPQGACAVEDLLDLVGVRAVDDNDTEPRLSQHLVGRQSTTFPSAVLPFSSWSAGPDGTLNILHAKVDCGLALRPES
jgi:hypothetical protein